MTTIDTVWAVLHLLGAAQGLFLAAVLLTHPGPRRVSARILGVLVSVFVVMIASELIDLLDAELDFPHLLLVVFPLPLALGPLVLLYAQRIRRARPLRPRDLLHFLPVVVVALWLAPFYALPGDQKIAALYAGFGPSFQPLVILKGLQAVVYLVAALWVCRRHVRGAVGVVRTHLLWYQRLLLAVLAPVVIVHVLHFAPLTGVLASATSDRLGSLLAAALIYVFAFAAMRRPFFWKEEASPASRLASAPRRPASSPLTGEQRSDLLDALLDHTEREQPYRDPEVGLADLAGALGVSTHVLSQLLNDDLGVTFYTFVNQRRVQLVQEMIADPANDDRKLLALAFDAGFNSKSSFNRVFKERVGCTPSAYRRDVRAARRPAAAGQPDSTA